ncbi:hypothetical protein [Natronorubrum halophilum]|uniref:hypothetical protein n=1 Tax=Natronorubrum halophilum TaxID=1702106 RepID=UPI0010C16E31|nr:hypothetical protein [Natronorubrum halophilum]
MIDGGFTLDVAIRVMTFLVGVQVIVSSLEHLYTWDRFADDGLLNWEVSKRFIRTGGPLAPAAERILRPPRFRLLVIARLLIAITISVMALFGRVSWVLLLLLLTTHFGIVYRQMAGLSGAFQMQLVVVPGLLLATLFPDGSFVQTAAVLFIAAQAVLSYLIAGVSKPISPDWQTGSAILGVFSTEVWGDERLYRLLQRFPQLNWVGAWLVIAFECLFPIVLFVDPQWAVVVFTTGILFHGFNAVFMGLNKFVIAFPATYPAVYYANQVVRGAL